MPGTGRIAPRHALLLIAGLTFLAYLPALSGDYVFDDERFIEKNEAVTHLTGANFVRYFTDPSSQAWVGHDIYRPLRTLDFAIDWAITSDPWLFHLKSILYHIAACFLLYALLRRLGLVDLAALFGTLAFALHPANVETVAWITSRGDVLLLIFFLLALYLHITDRRGLALAAFLLALLSKEVAVMFPAAALVADHFRGVNLRSIKRWAWYGAYGLVAVIYLAVWFQLVAGGKVEKTAHMAGWWGDHYGLNLLTMAKGFLHYLRVMVFPVNFTVDYHVPTSIGFGAGEIVALVVVLTVVVAALRTGPRSRFALLWFLATLLPASNLVRPIGIPTAERFLYVPLAGVALWAGPVLFKGRRLTWVLLSCLLMLTFARSVTWCSVDRLFQYALDTSPGPRSLGHAVSRELKAAHTARHEARGARLMEKPELEKKMLRHAEEVLVYADRLVAMHENVLRKAPGESVGATYSQKANALILLNRPKEALAAADRAIQLGVTAPAYFNAGLALEALGRYEEAAMNFTAAHEAGYLDNDLRPGIARFWLMAGGEKENRGDRDGALEAYRKAWEILPDQRLNRAAWEAIRRMR